MSDVGDESEPAHDPAELAGDTVFFEATRLWDSETYWDDAIAPLQVRRAEMLNPADRGDWWSDLLVWSDWLIQKYRLAAIIRPCWPRHGAIVEELQALWLGWQSAWLSGSDPEAPLRWHSYLDQMLSRVELRWQFGACTPADHTEPTAITVPYSRSVSPDTPRFAPGFDE